MPKLVDHAERRRAIVAATWRLIAARGIDGINMRDLAEEAGYANGSLKHYFASKTEIIETAHDFVVDATDKRIEQSVGAQRGMTAFRGMCYEIMPLTEVTQLEARVVVAFWQRAATDENMKDANNAAVAAWRHRLRTHLSEAMENGEIRPVDCTVFADLVLTTLLGMQVTATLETTAHLDRLFIEQFETLISPLSP